MGKNNHKMGKSKSITREMAKISFKTSIRMEFSKGIYLSQLIPEKKSKSKNFNRRIKETSQIPKIPKRKLSHKEILPHFSE